MSAIGNLESYDRNFIRKSLGLNTNFTKDGKRSLRGAGSGLLDYAYDKKGNVDLGNSYLNTSGEDALLAGLEDSFRGTASRSQALGGLDPATKLFIAQFGMGLEDQTPTLKDEYIEKTSKKMNGVGGFLSSKNSKQKIFQKYDGPKVWGISTNGKGYFNIFTAKQYLPKIREKYGDRIADKFSAFIDQEIENAKGGTKTMDEMPEYQRQLVQGYMGNAQAPTAMPTQNWGAIGSNYPTGYFPQAPIQPVAAPQVAGLFGLMPVQQGGLNATQQQIANAAQQGQIR